MKYYTFTSDYKRGGYWLTPYIIDITDTHVSYRKRNFNLVNHDYVSIPLDKVSAVSLDATLIGTDIKITSYGFGEICVKNFSLSDALKIKKIIENNI